DLGEHLPESLIDNVHRRIAFAAYADVSVIAEAAADAAGKINNADTHPFERHTGYVVAVPVAVTQAPAPVTQRGQTQAQLLSRRLFAGERICSGHAGTAAKAWSTSAFRSAISSSPT